MSDTYACEFFTAAYYLKGEGSARDALDAFGITVESTEAEILEAAAAARAEADEEYFVVAGDMVEAIKAIIPQVRAEA